MLVHSCDPLSSIRLSWACDDGHSLFVHSCDPLSSIRLSKACDDGHSLLVHSCDPLSSTRLSSLFFYVPTLKFALALCECLLIQVIEMKMFNSLYSHGNNFIL